MATMVAHDRPADSHVVDEEAGAARAVPHTRHAASPAMATPAMATPAMAAPRGHGDMHDGDGKDGGNQLSRTQALMALGLMLLCFCGVVLYIAGLSAFQHYVNSDRNTNQWAIPSNFPYLTPAHIFRWDWWVLAGYFIVWLYVGAVLIMRGLHITRSAVAALLAAFAVLMAISADRFYNARTFVSASQAQFRSTSVAFAGALVCSTSFFLLLLVLGARRWRF